jgi:hypothetical protein
MTGYICLCRYIVALALLGGCQKGTDAGEGKRLPKPPPPPQADTAVEVRIPVDVPGGPARIIDGARLRAVPPDFSDGERRAWRLGTLLGGGLPAGAALTVTNDRGMSVTMPLAAQDGLEPVLTVTKRGEVMAARVDPKSPFPPYHGQGGRLHRPGDPEPRINAVRSMRVHVDR